MQTPIQLGREGGIGQRKAHVLVCEGAGRLTINIRMDVFTPSALKSPKHATSVGAGCGLLWVGWRGRPPRGSKSGKDWGKGVHAEARQVPESWGGLEGLKDSHLTGGSGRDQGPARPEA